MSKPSDRAYGYTADVILFARDAERVLHVLLIQRSLTSSAYPGHWALPGGYLDPGESPRQAAHRELREETHLTAPMLTWVGHYDTPGRDPRGDVASTAYTAVLDHMPTPQADDDARNAEWVPVPLAFERPLAFDHAVILTDALATFSELTEGT